MRNRPPIAVVATLYCLAVSLLTGCGGGGAGAIATTATGRAVFTIAASRAVTRVIPVDWQVIEITISTANTPNVGSGSVLKTATSQQVTIANLPTNQKLTATVQAFASATPAATDIPLATATTTFSINGTTPVNVSITLQSTVAKLSIQGQAVMALNSTQTLMATALDSAGNVVPIGADSLIWTSSNPQVATVDTGGTVSAIALGQASIMLTQADSHRTAVFPITVSTSGGSVIVIAQ